MNTHEAQGDDLRSRIDICQLTSGHAIDDERILHRFARTAAEHGYRSSIAGPSDDTVTFPGVNFVACPRRVDGKSGFSRRCMASLPVLWWALKNRRDLYQIHDPDLLPAGLVLRLLGRRVVYDVHDDYEASIRDRLRKRRWLSGCISRLWWWFERTAARAFNGVVVADRHLARKFARCNPVVLGNYPRLDFTSPAHTEREKSFNLIYVGGITRERGLGMVLDALKRFPAQEIRLYVIGSGRDEVLLNELRAEQRVVLHGQVPWTRLQEYYERAHVGLALYQPLAGFITVDHSVKIVEYMAAGIPVLCSDFPGLRRLVQDAGCGLVAQPDNPDAIAGKIQTMFDDRSLCARLGGKGRELFESEYNWEKHAHKQIALYDRILKR